MNEGNIVRLSYAQVAQHHKEKAERDKQAVSCVNADEEPKKDPIPPPKGMYSSYLLKCNLILFSGAYEKLE